MSEQFENEIARFREIFDLELPSSVLDRLVILFADGNAENWDVENLSYCFKGGAVECPFYKGYFYIPGFSRYAINRQGDVLVIKTSRLKKWSKSVGNVTKNITGGYLVSHGRSDEGVRKGLTRHRALCLTFKHPGTNIGKLWVNHLNGIPGSDDLDNLEFCTPGQNVKHAYDTGLHDNKLVPVSITNWITGQTHEFTSIRKCMDFLDKSEGYITGRLRAGNHKRYSDGWRIKYRSDVWKDLDKYENHMSCNVEIICRNIFSGDRIIFGSISEASRYTGVSNGTLISLTAKSSPTPIMGWDFRRLEDFEGWPRYNQQHLDIFKKYPLRPVDGIEVFDCNTNETMFFVDSQEAGDYFNISPITASKLARYEKTRDKRFIFKLFRIKEPFNGPLLE